MRAFVTTMIFALLTHAFPAWSGSFECKNDNYTKQTLCSLIKIANNCINSSTEIIEKKDKSALLKIQNVIPKCFMNKSYGKYKFSISDDQNYGSDNHYKILELSIEYKDYDTEIIQTYITQNKEMYLFYGDNDFGINVEPINDKILNFKANNATHTKNFIYTIGEDRYLEFPDGDIHHEDGNFYVYHKKVYGDVSQDPPIGAFWLNAKLDNSGEIIDVFGFKKSKDTHCYNIEVLPKWIKVFLEKKGQSELCVFE